jgi:hypothetical protein
MPSSTDSDATATRTDDDGNTRSLEDLDIHRLKTLPSHVPV